MLVLSFPEEYPWVLLSAAIIAFQVYMSGFFVAGAGRAGIFSKEMMEQFKDEHVAAFP